MNWLDWLGLFAMTAVCIAMFFGCRGALKRCRKVEDRMYDEVKQFNDELAERLRRK